MKTYFSPAQAVTVKVYISFKDLNSFLKGDGVEATYDRSYWAEPIEIFVPGDAIYKVKDHESQNYDFKVGLSRMYNKRHCCEIRKERKAMEG